MNREEFMRQLEHLLWNIPESDKLDAIAYYNNYFDEAGIENEAQVIRELGSPEKVAETIRNNADMESSEEKDYTEQGCYSGYDYTSKNVPQTKEVSGHKGGKGSIPVPLLIILIVFASPILVAVGGGLLGGLLGLLGGLVGVIAAVAGCGFGLTIGGVACLAVGVYRVFFSPMEGLVCIGVGGILGALGMLCVLLFAWLVFKWLPALFRVCINGCKKIFHRGERGNIA